MVTMAAKKKASTKKKAVDTDKAPEPEVKEVEGPKKVTSQLFEMIRNADDSGISGTGLVAEGVLFSTGKCVVTFIGDGATPSVIVWDSFEQFRKIHIDSHPNNDTELVWYDRRKRTSKK